MYVHVFLVHSGNVRNTSSGKRLCTHFVTTSNKEENNTTPEVYSFCVALLRFLDTSIELYSSRNTVLEPPFKLSNYEYQYNPYRQLALDLYKNSSM